MQPDIPTSAKKQTLAYTWFNLPFVAIGVVVFFIVSANLFFIIYRLRLPYPASPWEAGIVTDAWRMLQGESIYAKGTDHATHMYGPLIIVVLAQAFEITGPTFLVGRLVSAISGIAVVLLLATMFGRSNRLAFAVAVALLLAANSRSGYYFTETRPDMISVFFATLALIVLYHGQEPEGKAPRRVAIVLAGSALLVIAVMFKQPAGAFVFVPALAMLAKSGKFSFRNQFLFAAIPVVGMLVTLGAICYLAPGLWHLMVEVPAQYKVSVLRMARMAVELLTSFPLFVLALMHWLFTDARDNWQLPRIRWLMAAMICAIPSSLAAFAKDGGAPNSLIPAILTIGAFCAWRVPVALSLLRDTCRSLPLRIATGMLLGILLFAHTYPVPGQLGEEALKGGYGVDDRALVVAEARLLPGKVICPDDPTIPLTAKGYAGRTAVFEADAVYWDPNRTMEVVLKEIDSADYVIAMRHGWLPGGKALVTMNFPEWATSDDVLLASGFIKSRFRTTSTPVYQLWRRARPPGLPPALPR